MSIAPPRPLGQRHPCPATGCARMLSHTILMCPAHWRMVPPAAQRLVVRAWRAWNAGTGSMTDYLAARDAAIAAVNGAAAPRE